MTDTELNLRYNTILTNALLSLILSWVTPYAWWQDALLVVLLSAWMAIPLVWKAEGQP